MAPGHCENDCPSIETFLLGRISYADCLQLQHRLLEEVADRDDGQVIVLLCEHPTIVTVGRGGSPTDVAMHNHLIRNGQVEVRWVNRGGGCLVHCPGQLAVYPIVPLAWHGLLLGEYLDRLRAALIETFDDLGVHATASPGNSGVWGRTGQLAALGVSVRRWIAYHGCYVNVCPSMGLFRLVEEPLDQPGPTSCLVAERRGRVTMTSVRSVLAEHLAAALGCQRSHVHTGHPLLRR